MAQFEVTLINTPLGTVQKGFCFEGLKERTLLFAVFQGHVVMAVSARYGVSEYGDDFCLWVVGMNVGCGGLGIEVGG